MSKPMRIVSVAGARPNFMKIAPIVAELARFPDVFQSTLIHTGQHYDDKLSRVFFDELNIPRPDVNLNVGSGSHAQQTAAIMSAFEPAFVASHPDLLLVVGDVNSTIACALVAVKLGIPIAHVEAGLRSFDRSMPEEVNRLLTDQISDLLFTTEAVATDNLLREGVDGAQIHFVGNVMIDTLLLHVEKARHLKVAERFGLARKAYAVLTLHRPSNVDDPAVFGRLMSALDLISQDVPIVFPVHPRTRPALNASSITASMVSSGRLMLIDPLGYLEFISLTEGSRVALTDSGGMQQETTILGIPCLTLRENTEVPVTVSHGTNRLVGTDVERIVAVWRELEGIEPRRAAPPLWDGHAAQRIVEVLAGRA
jgi:UDP-N-acetylglucosamine 2-epimerase (non-hydrolysing)